MTTKILARTGRITTTTFAIIGAPPARLLKTFGWKTVVPFEVDVTWRDGIIDWDVTVRGWVMRNGSPRKLVTGRVDMLGAGSPWMFPLFHETPEPGITIEPAAEPDENRAEPAAEEEVQA